MQSARTMYLLQTIYMQVRQDGAHRKNKLQNLRICSVGPEIRAAHATARDGIADGCTRHPVSHNPHLEAHEQYCSGQVGWKEYQGLVHSSGEV